MMIDPPHGYLYGFPKEIPDEITDINKWLVENGYPESLIQKYGNGFYYRYWNETEKLKEINNGKKANKDKERRR